MAQIGLFPDGPLEGTIIGGKYRLDRKISEGGGGVVWEATDGDSEKIALKFLKWSPLKSRDSSAERFKNEFAILKSLSHPNIARIYDFGIDPDTDQYFFTSEIFTEGDLKEIIGAPVEVIEELLLQALRSLEYLNNNHLLHLDIKPQNLMIKERGQKNSLALIDFGLATFRPPDKPGGTANYMPPELVARRLQIDEANYPSPDHRSDLYSLGVTFYYCLTGVQPFCCKTQDGKNVDVQATLKNHLHGSPPPPSTHRSEIPPYLDRIIMKLMSRHPDDRYPSAIVAAQAIQFSSPRKYPPETKQTLLAYLPKAGKLVGRKNELEKATNILAEAGQNISTKTPFICIAGRTGTGRSRFIRALKPVAQQFEMDVNFVEACSKHDDQIHKEKRPTALLIDGIEECITGNNHDPQFEQLVRSFIRRTELQIKLPSAFPNKSVLIFTLNTDKIKISDALKAMDINDSSTVVLELKNFTKTEIQEYLSALIGDTPSPTVVEQLISSTSGNPYFITEYLEEMIARGNLFSLAGRCDSKTLTVLGLDFTQAPLPKSLADTVLERIKALPPEAREIALTLACWHRAASADEIKMSCNVKDPLIHLLALVNQNIIRRSSHDGRFSFANTLTSSIIKQRTDQRKISEAHDRILNHLKNSKKVKRDELVWHIAYGTKVSGKISALERLANLAVDENRVRDAAIHFSNLMDLIPDAEWERKATILARIGRLFERSHMQEEAARYYKQIIRLKAPAKYTAQLALTSNELLGRLEVRKRNLKAAKKIFDSSLKLCKGKKGFSAWKIKVENYIAGIDLREGKIEAAIERFEHTAQMADRVLNKNERNLITNNELGESLLRSNNYKEALIVLKNELKDAERTKDSERAANRLYLIGNALRSESIAQFEKAKESYSKALNIARNNRLVNLEIRLHNGLGNLYQRLNQPKLALKHYSDGLKLSQQVDSFTTSVELMIGMGLTSQKSGDPSSAIEYFSAALDFAGGPKGTAAGLIRRYSPTIYVSLGDAYYQTRDFEKANEFLEKARKLDRKSPLSPDLRYSLYGTLAEIYTDYENIEEAKKLFPLLDAISISFPPAKAHLANLKKRISMC